MNFFAIINRRRTGLLDYPLVKVALIIIGILLITPVIGEITTESADTMQAAADSAATNIRNVMMLLSTVDKGSLCINSRSDAKITVWHDRVLVEIKYGSAIIRSQASVHLLEDIIFVDTPKIFDWKPGSNGKRKICFSKNETHFWASNKTGEAYKPPKIDSPPFSISPSNDVNSSVPENIPACVAVTFGKNMKMVNDTIKVAITNVGTGASTYADWNAIVAEAGAKRYLRDCNATYSHYPDGSVQFVKYIYDFQDDSTYKVNASVVSKFDKTPQVFELEAVFNIKGD